MYKITSGVVVYMIFNKQSVIVHFNCVEIQHQQNIEQKRQQIIQRQQKKINYHSTTVEGDQFAPSGENSNFNLGEGDIINESSCSQTQG